MPKLDGPHQYLLQRRPQMLQSQGSAGQARDHHHRERSQLRSMDQGEATIQLSQKHQFNLLLEPNLITVTLQTHNFVSPCQSFLYL